MKKQYDREFKLQICRKIIEKETTVTKVAKEYSISRPIVSRWVSEYQRYQNNAFSGKGNKLPDKAKIYAIEKKVKDLELENEILKKFEAFVKKERKKGSSS